MYKNPPLTIIRKKKNGTKKYHHANLYLPASILTPSNATKKNIILVIMATSILDSHNLYIPAK